MENDAVWETICQFLRKLNKDPEIHYIAKKNENMCPHKDMFTHIHLYTERGGEGGRREREKGRWGEKNGANENN